MFDWLFLLVILDIDGSGFRKLSVLFDLHHQGYYLGTLSREFYSGQCIDIFIGFVYYFIVIFLELQVPPHYFGIGSLILKKHTSGR